MLLVQRGDTFSDVSCEHAVLSGNLDCLKYVLEVGCPVTQRAFTAAVKYGHIDCVKHMHNIVGKTLESPFNCDVAASRGQLDCFKYLYEHDFRCSYTAAFCATQAGHLHILQYMNTLPGKHCWFQSCPRAAAVQGHLDLLQFFNDNGYPWNDAIIALCAKHGHLHCLTYLHEHGCPWDMGTCSSAVYGDQLDCLKYAIQHECVFSYNLSENFRPQTSQAMREYVAVLDAEEDSTCDESLSLYEIN